MASRTSRRVRMRCGRPQRHRFTLKRHPDEYKRTPKCPHCGTLNIHVVEQERRRELITRGQCRCNGYPFPHRPGSLRFCDQHPKAGEEPTEEEEQDYRSVLETPRSGFM